MQNHVHPRNHRIVDNKGPFYLVVGWRWIQMGPLKPHWVLLCVRDGAGGWLKGFAYHLDICSVLCAELWGILNGIDMAWWMDYRKNHRGSWFEVCSVDLLLQHDSSHGNLAAITELLQRQWHVRLGLCRCLSREHMMEGGLSKNPTFTITYPNRQQPTNNIITGLCCQFNGPQRESAHATRKSETQ